MSSTQADINMDISDTCDFKCRLILEYPSEGIIIEGTDKSDNASIEGINTNELVLNANNTNGKIKYNNIDKKLDSIHIVKPSLHTYANRRIDAELILVHEDAVHGDVLICIPLISKSYSGILDEILVGVEQSIKLNPSLKPSLNLNLKDVVPKKPFYAYTGGIETDGNINNMNIIVFRKMDALSINEKRLNTLTPHDASKKFKLINNQEISYNENGPENIKTDQLFPITCEPVPIDGAEYDEEPDKSFKAPFIMSEADLNEWGNKAIVQIIVGIIIILFLYSVFGFIFKRTNKIASSVSDPVGSTEFK